MQQGAGGMVMIDPAFQRALVQHCQQRNIPVIVDEVFTGLWRLGHMSASQLLGVKPDIACYAKLLTGEPLISMYTSCIAWQMRHVSSQCRKLCAQISTFIS